MFASNFMYLHDAFNSFDTFMVSISLLLNLLGLIIKGLGTIRLIRVVVIILRKIRIRRSRTR